MDLRFSPWPTAAGRCWAGYKTQNFLFRGGRANMPYTKIFDWWPRSPPNLGDILLIIRFARSYLLGGRIL
jgi:hypothetical protein